MSIPKQQTAIAQVITWHLGWHLMDPWLIYFVTYNSPLSDASYHAWNMATRSTR